MASTLQPVWLLDVDGVLNADSTAVNKVWGWQAVRRRYVTDARGWRFRMLCAQPVLDFITDIQVSGRADVRWCTTWHEEAVARLAPALGLPPMQLGPISRPDHEGAAKVAAAEAVLAAGRPLIWTDDEIIPPDFERRPAGTPLLLIRPESRLGLLPEHLSSISAFLDGLGTPLPSA